VAVLFLNMVTLQLSPRTDNSQEDTRTTGRTVHFTWIQYIQLGSVIGQ